MLEGIRHGRCDEFEQTSHIPRSRFRLSISHHHRRPYYSYRFLPQRSQTMNNHHHLDHHHDQVHNDLLLDEDQQAEADQRAIDLTFHRIACLQERIRRQQQNGTNNATESYERIMQILEEYRPIQERRQRRHQDLLNRLMARHSTTTNNLFGNDDDNNEIHQRRASTSAATASSKKQDRDIEYLAVRTSEELTLEKEVGCCDDGNDGDDDDDLICPICVDPLVELSPPTPHGEDGVDSNNNTATDTSTNVSMAIAVTQKCQHRFHEHCLMEWLKSKNCEENRHCPMCRERISETENMFFVYQKCKILNVVVNLGLEETENCDDEDELIEEVYIEQDETQEEEDNDSHPKKGKHFHDGLYNFVSFWLPLLILIWWSQNWISYWNSKSLTA